ncbi:MAG: DUF3341 domain-containing protein [Planctomycetes bacterium]|nr:DUF3341 domain-containing protein [Planctomycetota bacterium]
MPDVIHLALFNENDIDRASQAVSHLREMGISDRNISVISGVPYSDKVLDRPMVWTRIPLIALSGAGLGFIVALALSFGTPYLYPVLVGNQPLYAIPTSIVVIFELTMLGLLISTFIGVFVETISPTFGPKGYNPKISDGYIGVLFSCPSRASDRLKAGLVELGAELSEVE